MALTQAQFSEAVAAIASDPQSRQQIMHADYIQSNEQLAAALSSLSKLNFGSMNEAARKLVSETVVEAAQKIAGIIDTVGQQKPQPAQRGFLQMR